MAGGSSNLVPQKKDEAKAQRRSSIRLSMAKPIAWLTRSTTPTSTFTVTNPSGPAPGRPPSGSAMPLTRHPSISQPSLQDTSNLAVRTRKTTATTVSSKTQTKSKDKDQANKAPEQPIIPFHRSRDASAGPPTTRRRPRSPLHLSSASVAPPRGVAPRGVLKHSAVPPSPTYPPSHPPPMPATNRFSTAYTSLPPFEAVLLTERPQPGTYSRQTIITLETANISMRTTLETLYARPSELERYVRRLCPDPVGFVQGRSAVIHIFLDRPSDPYPNILTYLRSVVHPDPSSPEMLPTLPRSVQLPMPFYSTSMVGTTRLDALLELRDEARWVKLEELERLCDRELLKAGVLQDNQVPPCPIDWSHRGSESSQGSSAPPLSPFSTTSNASTSMTMPSPGLPPSAFPPYPTNTRHRSISQSNPYPYSHSQPLPSIAASPTSIMSRSGQSSRPSPEEDEEMRHMRVQLSSGLRLRPTSRPVTPAGQPASDSRSVRTVNNVSREGKWRGNWV